MNQNTFALRTGCAAFALFAALGDNRALAWGHTGHVEMGQAAIGALPAEIPAFLRTASAIRTIGELSAEADVSKSSGNIHDFDRDPGHYIDIDDSGYVLGLQTLPFATLLTRYVSRRDFDTASRAASPTGSAPLGSQTQYSGYLPYQMVDGWQQLRKDFGYIRAFTAAIANPATAPADRAFFQVQLQIRQTLTLRDVGFWSHFVEDASQPDHVSVHFNGWGNYPNPNNYTTAPIHAPFEGSFVKANVGLADISSRIGAYVPCGCFDIQARVTAYLTTTLGTVEQQFIVEKLSPLFAGSNPTQVAYAADRVAAGAQELRDEIVDAWRASDTITVGFVPGGPQLTPRLIEAGTVWTANAFAND